MKKRFRLTLEQRKGVWGFIFLLPWIIGFLLFFARPIFETIRFSFSEVTIQLGSIDLDFVGLDNYRQSLTVDPHFNQYILTLFFPGLFNVAIVVIFSLLAAILINGKFFGRTVVRTIFFIPIILGAMLASATMVGGDAVTETTTFFAFGGMDGSFFLEILAAAGVPGDISNYINAAVTGIFEVLAHSGVSILIFLAGLQAIPASLYEVAKIEGSTSYESFWKVTLPMISPMVLLSTVYTVVEQFSRHELAELGNMAAFVARVQFISTNQGFGIASAQIAMFIVVSLLTIGLITWIISKGVFYYD